MSSGAGQEFRASRSKARHGAFVGSLLVVLGLWVIFLAGDTVPNRNWLGALNLVLGLAIAFFAWTASRKRGVSLRLDDRGIWFQDWGLTVPWRVIHEAYPTGTRLQPFIAVQIKDAKSFVASLPEQEARALRGNRLWKPPELKIPFGAVEASHQVILDAITAEMRGREVQSV